MELGQVYYPESLHRMYIVNTPLFFRGIWKIVTAWIHPDTCAKIVVLVC